MFAEILATPIMTITDKIYAKKYVKSFTVNYMSELGYENEVFKLITCKMKPRQRLQKAVFADI